MPGECLGQQLTLGCPLGMAWEWMSPPHKSTLKGNDGKHIWILEAVQYGNVGIYMHKYSAVADKSTIMSTLFFIHKYPMFLCRLCQ